MSHFSVLVIGEDVEGQLAKYDEQLDTPEYKKGEVSEEEKTRFMEFYSEKYPEDKGLSFDEMYAKHGESWNGNDWRKDEDGLWSEYSSYNPNSKWDWYSIGGRWSGRVLFTKKPLPLGFELEGFSTPEVNNLLTMYKENKKKFEKVVSKYNGKSAEIRKVISQMAETIEKLEDVSDELGNGVDETTMGEVDWEGMRKRGENRGREYYNKVKAALGGVIPQPEVAWMSMHELDEYKDWDIQKKRDFYHSQDALKKLEEAEKNDTTHELFGFGFNLEDFACGEEAYVKRCGDDAMTTFAVVKDGKWYERGEMGWFAMVANEKDGKSWGDEVSELLKDVPADTKLTIVDCHI